MRYDYYLLHPHSTMTSKGNGRVMTDHKTEPTLTSPNSGSSGFQWKSTGSIIERIVDYGYSDCFTRSRFRKISLRKVEGMVTMRTSPLRGAMPLLTGGLAAVLLVFTVVTPAGAAKPGHGGGSSSAIGYDVSYPQCGATLPTSPAFGIVGVNAGLANNTNPCFGTSSTYPSYSQSELYWATASASGVTTQPNVSLYVNTADPGNEYNGSFIADWPTTNSSTVSNPYGSCSTTTITINATTYTVGQDSQACAWQYGYNMMTGDMARLANAAAQLNGLESGYPISSNPQAYQWWLDIETANSWQSGTSGQAMNFADVRGMDAAEAGGPAGGYVGVYTTAAQWGQIIGVTSSSLALPEWVPGAKTQSGAAANCTQSSFTGGPVMLTQWTSRLDNDYVC